MEETAVEANKPTKIPTQRHFSYCHSVGHTIRKCALKIADVARNEQEGLASFELIGIEQEFFDSLHLVLDPSPTQRAIMKDVKELERIEEETAFL